VGGGECSTDGLGAQMMTLGYLYRFSRDTDVYAVGYQVLNKNSASYTPFPPNDPQPAPGANVRSIGVGILHHFSVTASTKE
jgi:predicted porin